jgi:nucleotide-binding universal stress UspA family protein
MKTILFPTDFSKVSANALEYAIEIAQLLSARILLLYAVRSFADRDTFIEAQKFNSEAEAEKALKELSAQIAGKVPCEYIIKTGAITDEISAVAKKQQVSMVIMGTKGAGTVPDSLALLNSTTVDLISERVCPVLAIPAKTRFTSMHKIVLAVDNESVEAAVLAPLLELAQVLQAEIALLTIVSDPKEPAAKNNSVERILNGINYSSHQLHNEDVIDGIGEFMKTHPAHLLAVIARKRNFLLSLFSDSITQKLALHSKIPLLVLTE